MSYKMIVLDIDGTLTNGEKVITDRTRKAIKDMQEKGYKVVLASGRPTTGVIPIANELELKKYGGFILAFNGAKIINCSTGEVLFQEVMPKDMMQVLYDEAIKNHLGLISYEGDTVICGTEIDRFIEKEANINNMPIIDVDDFVEYITFDVNKCLMTAEGNYLAKIEEQFKKDYGHRINVFRSEPFFLELMPLNVDKAYSVKKLIEHMGILREEVIAVGDGFNDVSMIKYAGLGVAMANAQDIVKESADYITKSNDEDGVFHVIEKFFD